MKRSVMSFWRKQFPVVLGIVIALSCIGGAGELTAQVPKTSLPTVDRVKAEGVYRAATRLQAALDVGAGRDYLLQLAADLNAELIFVMDRASTLSRAEKILIGLCGEQVGIVKLLVSEGFTQSMIGTPAPWLADARAFYLKGTMPDQKKVDSALSRFEKMVAEKK